LSGWDLPDDSPWKSLATPRWNDTSLATSARHARLAGLLSPQFDRDMEISGWWVSCLVSSTTIVAVSRFLLGWLNFRCNLWVFFHVMSKRKYLTMLERLPHQLHATFSHHRAAVSIQLGWNEIGTGARKGMETLGRVFWKGNFDAWCVWVPGDSWKTLSGRG
jgi:hypothetical protein